jgi:hypothetical protein
MPYAKDEETLAKTFDHVRFSFQDFFVEFLGGLVPGVLFLLGGFLALAPPLDAILTGHPRLPGDLIAAILKATSETHSIIWVILSMIAILVAYVLGHLFYRQEPKKPDQQSLRRITKGLIVTNEPPTGLGGLAREVKALYLRLIGYKVERVTKEQYTERLRADYGCTVEECDFPYLFLKTYLKKRGHNHLLALVRWDPSENGGDGQLADYRSKTYINLLKIRLTYHHPRKCGTIVRNEAHVRLASSTWYVAKALRWFSLAGFGLGLVALSGVIQVNVPSETQSMVSVGLGVLVAPLLVLIAGRYCKVTIEKVLHYQRLREVCFVLETSYTAFRDTPHLLVPPFEEFPKSCGDSHLAETGDSAIRVPGDCPRLLPNARHCPFLENSPIGDLNGG